jgi:hypothetical protein
MVMLDFNPKTKFTFNKDAVIDCMKAGLCSGHGQKYTTKYGQYSKYLTVSLEDIQGTMTAPPSVAKEKAQWVILSTLPSRVNSDQRENGLYTALNADLDDLNGFTFEDIISRAGSVLDYTFWVYTSRSAKEENPKSHIIIPFSDPVPGEDYILLQKILIDKLASVELIADPKMKTANQLVYLPNRGEYYRYHIEASDGPMPPDHWEKDLSKERQRIDGVHKTREARREVSRLKAIKRMLSGCKSPIDAFNTEYGLIDTLERYGAVRHGRDRWLSPNSESGTPGITIKGDKWFSSHGSDAGIGKKTDTGSMGDAFDLYVFYEHSGDRNTAIKKLGDMFTTDTGETFTKANQREYMEKKAKQETFEAFDQIPPGPGKPELFSLQRFVLNGTSEAMKAQMKEDKFILDRLAIQGQATAFYGKPNAGKTLLVLKMIIEGIQDKRIDGSDVFFINADDTFKGLAYKLGLAEMFGFNMIAPGHPAENPFKAEMLAPLLKHPDANGKIIILDTVKKFTDLMRKDLCSKFGTDMREFVSRGGSVIMLAHVNKYKDADNKVIYSGTSDLVDDADCAYTINILSEDPFSNERTVIFENFKNRGDVALEATYKYNFATDTTYPDKLNSVQAISEDEHKALIKYKELEEKYKKNQEAVDAIRELLKAGDKKQTDITKELGDNHGISKRKTLRALKDHEGLNVSKFQYWHTVTGDKNAKFYKLN